MKKGFTLIELLAVIFILSIITLIAIPTVTKITNQSKKGAFETTASNIVTAIEEKCQLQILKGEAIVETYTFTDGEVSPNLNIKGKLPTSGNASVDSNCNVTVGLSNGTYTATKNHSTDSITVIKGNYEFYSNGTAIYFNPETGEKCTSGEAVSTTGIKTGCMKWYAFNDGGTLSDNINLILDHNTTAAVTWNSTGSNVNGPTNVISQLASDTSSWIGVPTRTDSYSLSNGTASYTIDYSKYKARLITAAEVAMITNNISFVETTAPGSSTFYFDTNNQTQTSTSIGTSNYAWLFDYTNGCTSYGCNIDDLGTIGYWTSTSIYDNFTGAWRTILSGKLNYGLVDREVHAGLRPVITIPKIFIK